MLKKKKERKDKRKQKYGGNIQGDGPKFLGHFYMPF